MGIKRKLGMGVANALLAVSLIGGGTYAYFSDEAETNNTFAAGTLDLNVDPSVIIEVDSLKPGDTVERYFYLKNDGSLDISKIVLHTEYDVEDAKGDNTEDFGKHIMVHFLENTEKTDLDPTTWEWNYNDIVSSVTLYDLQNLRPDAVEKLVPLWLTEQSGLEAESNDLMYVLIEFVDNGEEQNQFQGDKLKLKWTFDAHQTDGTNR